MNLYADVESVGLVGATKLIQYSIEDGPVELIPLYKNWSHNPETRDRVGKLLSLLNDSNTVFIAFNSSFDLFKLYTVAHELLGYSADSSERPVMPFACKVLDLYVPAVQNSPLAPFAFQKSKSKSIARVRRIPAIALDRVVPVITEHLQRAIPEGLPLSIGIHQCAGQPHLKTVSWTIDARLSLKGLMKAYGYPTIPIESVWPLPEKGTEATWLPYPQEDVHGEVERQCEAIMRNPDSGFWRYAQLDIWYLKALYEKLGRPQPDHHSTCTHVVGYTRYYGFDLDQATLRDTEDFYAHRVRAIEQQLAGIDLNSPKQRLEALRRVDPLIASSAKKVLQVAIATERPCAELAEAMMGYGPARQRLLQVQKVRQSKTGRAHPSLRVMGTRTGRMAGEAGLNWQGIGQAELVDLPVEETEKENAELSEGYDELVDEAMEQDEFRNADQTERQHRVGIRHAMFASAVGDWSSFEVILGANIYQDEAMFYDLEHGVDPHSMNASLMQPDAIKHGWTYEYIHEQVKKGDPYFTKLRKMTKPCSFGLQYLCAAPKLAETLGVSLQEGEAALKRYYERYKGFAKYRENLEHESLTADTEQWDRHSVSKMAYQVTDLTGYKMDWSFEAKVADILWQLGGTGIKTGLSGTVLRTSQKGMQTVDGAIKSSLLGGALAIQQAVMRQRGNAKVQATGANITKLLAARLWDKYRTPMLNIHDELVFPCHTAFEYGKLKSEVDAFTGEWSSEVRLLNFDFHPTERWSDK